MNYLFQSYCRFAVADVLLQLFSSYCLLGACVIVVKYKIFGTAVCADSEQPCRSDEGNALLEDGVVNVVCRSDSGATRRREVEDTGSDPS